MITDINKKYITSELNKSKLADYWGGYFEYENNAQLHSLIESELVTEVNKCKQQPKPFVDSQVIIGTVLTRLGNKHSFHRQFSEQFPSLHREQILGMQLYTIMLKDADTWIYYETQHPGHIFPHATYFK